MRLPVILVGSKPTDKLKRHVLQYIRGNRVICCPCAVLLCVAKMCTIFQFGKFAILAPIASLKNMILVDDTQKTQFNHLHSITWSRLRFACGSAYFCHNLICRMSKNGSNSTQYLNLFPMKYLNIAFSLGSHAHCCMIYGEFVNVASEMRNKRASLGCRYAK